GSREHQAWRAGLYTKAVGERAAVELDSRACGAAPGATASAATGTGESAAARGRNAGLCCLRTSDAAGAGADCAGGPVGCQCVDNWRTRHRQGDCGETAPFGISASADAAGGGEC